MSCLNVGFTQPDASPSAARGDSEDRSVVSGATPTVAAGATLSHLLMPTSNATAACVARLLMADLACAVDALMSSVVEPITIDSSK